MLQRFQFVMKVAEASASRDGLVQHRTPRHLFHILAEIADRQLLRHGNLALVRRFFAGYHAKERGFSGAVRADKPDLLAGVELEGSIDEQNLAAVLLADA